MKRERKDCIQSSETTRNRVFVRVDNNDHYSAPTPFAKGDDGYIAGIEESVFGDFPEGTDEDKAPDFVPRARPAGAPLPDHVRKEILELGFPDDGYNYHAHLREIRKSGAGSNYYENSKAKLDSVPFDVKAYDASKVRLKPDSSGVASYSMYDVAAKTVSVKIDKAVDPDVVRLLDDSDLSRFGSDMEDLEEDFVVRANHPEEAEEGECSGSKSTEANVILQLDLVMEMIPEFLSEKQNQSWKKLINLEVEGRWMNSLIC